MARFERAVRAAAAVLNGGSVSLNTWAHTVSECDELLGGLDPAIRRAADLRSVVVVEPLQRRRTALREVGLDVPAGTPPTQLERRELRAVALYVTRAASRDAEGTSRLVLAGVERSLLGVNPPSRSFEAGLDRWRQTLASTIDTIDPCTALVVSRSQYGLLSAGVLAMKGLEVADGVGHERLLAALEASRIQWLRAYESWKEMVPRQTAPTDDLRKAMLALQLAAAESSEADKLRGLLATGFGGNLAAALAVTPADMRVDSDLVAGAVTLEQRSDLAAAIRPRRVRESEPVSAPAGLGLGSAVEFTSSTEVPTPHAPSVRPPDVGRVDLADHERFEELAGERDAGVIAAAARAGVADAVALVGDATAGELDRLVERGENARATIAASALPMAYYWSRRAAPEHRQDVVSAASVRMVQVAGRWDPRMSRWSTYAYREADFAYREEARLRARSREVVDDEVVRHAAESPPQLMTANPGGSPEEQLLRGVERDQMAQLLDRLPERMRVVMEGRLGLSGAQKTMAALGEATGASTTTVHRDAWEGVRQLREHDRAAKEAEKEKPSPVPAAVTLRLLAQVLQPTKEGRSTTLTSSRPEHRGGGPTPGVRGVSR